MADPENFIPFSQIEPLLEPGMIADDLVRLVLTKFGLAYKDYTLISIDLPDEDARRIPLLELCRRGLLLVKNPVVCISRGDEIIA